MLTLVEENKIENFASVYSTPLAITLDSIIRITSNTILLCSLYSTKYTTDAVVF